MGKTAIKHVSVDRAIEIAVKAALEHMQKEDVRRKRERHDRRLRNIKKLLKHYRSFKIHCSEAKEDLKSIGLPDYIAEELDQEELAVESIRRSKQRTTALVDFIDRMLFIYKILCVQSEKDEDIRRFQTIEKRYLLDREYSIEEIAEMQNVEKRTIYKDINIASESLSALMFGVDGIRMID